METETNINHLIMKISMEDVIVDLFGQGEIPITSNSLFYFSKSKGDVE